jgi:hypothetical protein
MKSMIATLCMFYMVQAGPPGAAQDFFTISLWKSPVQNDLRTLRALGLGEPPTNEIFIYNSTPRSNFCLLAPTQFSEQTPLFGRVDPVGSGLRWASANKILSGKPTPRSNFCLLAPAQSLTHREFQMGSVWEVSLGADIWGHLLARCRARVKWEAHAKFRGDGLCGSGGRPPDIHTHRHTHTLSSLYRRFLKNNFGTFL